MADAHDPLLSDRNLSPPISHAELTHQRTGLFAWSSQVTRYQWLVLLVAWLGWVFDSMDGTLFSLVQKPSMTELMGPGATVTGQVRITNGEGANWAAANGTDWYISGTPDSRWNNDRLVSELREVTRGQFEVVKMEGIVTP